MSTRLLITLADLPKGNRHRYLDSITFKIYDCAVQALFQLEFKDIVMSAKNKNSISVHFLRYLNATSNSPPFITVFRMELWLKCSEGVRLHCALCCTDVAVSLCCSAAE